MRYAHLLIAALPIMVLSCEREREPVPHDETTSAVYHLTAVPEDAVETRSDLIAESDVQSGSDYRMAVYTGGKKILSGPAPLDVRLDAQRSYNVYAWTGESLAREDAPAAESDLLAWTARYPGLNTSGPGTDAIRDYIESYGMPMAGMVQQVTPGISMAGNTLSVPLQRLFARIRLRIVYDAALTRLLPERTVQQVRVHNWAYACQPFGEGFDKALVRDGVVDYSTSADADGYYTLYLPENLQGALQQADTTRCSYLSVDLVFGDGIGFGGGVGSVCYRFYPGEDGYDIRRNHQYNVTLTLSYNGRFIEGDWQVTGDPAECRTLAFDHDESQAVAAAGSKAYLLLHYRYGDGPEAISSYFNRYNGIGVGLPFAIDDWVSRGTRPIGSNLEVVGSLRCLHCGNRFWGYPEAKNLRFDWANTILDADTEEVRCPVCRTHFFNLDDESEQRFYDGTPAGSDHYRVSQPEPHIAMAMPSNAEAGTLLNIMASTRDGRIQAQTRVAIGDYTTFYYNYPLDGEQYVAEKLVFEPLTHPDGVSSLSYRVVSGADCVALSPAPGSSFGQTISFLREGTADILVEDQNGIVRQRITRTIRKPGLRFISGNSNNVTSYSLAIDGTEVTPAWAYFKDDGQRYSSYDPELYTSCLGDATLSVDGTWTATSGGELYINRTHDDNLGDIPYLSASVGTLTAASSCLPDISCSANLLAVNPFTSWPATPPHYTVNYSWTESPKKVSSIPVYYDNVMALIPSYGPRLPLRSRVTRGRAPFGYSSAEAMAGGNVAPTIEKRPSLTTYYGSIRNKHSDTQLTRDFLTIAVNVEAYCTETHSSVYVNDNTRAWDISLVCHNSTGSIPTQDELLTAFPKTGEFEIYPTNSDWSEGLLSFHWYQATYRYQLNPYSYRVVIIVKKDGSLAVGDADFALFAANNDLQFVPAKEQSDGYSYLEIEGELLDAPSTNGVWKLRLNPAWQ